ncbi:TIGR04086 family membrane protein [Anaerobacillus alkaliphilus]|uniref:TIGR04086 family membrane protein n=1 Tax=Anaerobacillus alkaliphilus TaxID=1548597 RepID=A0A4Q0VT63_9BACI|nr:TIGR04086 family membrane protein [Anaerobacillus alkaliphilus]RXJ00023.1 TIGR04086 family membrane protein [Anaerobacillus alkaliphilus]
MVYGLVTILGIILSVSFIISLLLRFTALTETSFSWVIMILTFLALLVGGFVSGGKSKQKGWMVGAGTGLLYSLLVFLVQYLGYNATFTMEQYLFHGGFILAAIIGGIFGVNVVRNSRMV